MDHFFHIAIGTITMRPYVFAFLVAYLVAAVMHLGWRTTIWFTIIGYIISFTSEVCSINTGFPYGWYYYIDATKDREFWIAGVPFFDSLSYVFLVYCSYATALLVVSPIRAWRWNLVTLETRSIRRSLSVLMLGSLFTVFLDIVTDPVALQGKRWFLGQIYGYNEPGFHFGVPMSNYFGWWIVSVLMILALQLINALSEQRREKPAGVVNIPFRSLFGPILFLSVIVFNISVALLIGERLMAVTGIFIFTLPIAIISISIIRRTNRYDREELESHLKDYPWLPAVKG
ncbi:carotenoid biosynthesis protein [Geobacter grbiciae]|uniref:carotenoid biosynthesis protein n=1 Tax=Geobacter grbiciae TaxID=155042 RepID=UPI001C016CD8|nr:carotenoid biosynthesis protein [Geobacter grbiciae]MBT1077279.1 carotenoid biosynthesis protein [Geobacter grbiciae]